jgi:hypothetical protein
MCCELAITNDGPVSMFRHFNTTSQGIGRITHRPEQSWVDYPGYFNTLTHFLSHVFFSGIADTPAHLFNYVFATRILLVFLRLNSMFRSDAIVDGYKARCIRLYWNREVKKRGEKNDKTGTRLGTSTYPRRPTVQS